MMNEQQDKWLHLAEALFLRYGIKSITMDDVARELGISKKTLYTFVENKDDLVRKVVVRIIQDEKQSCIISFKQAKNAFEEIMLVIEMNSAQLAQMKSNIVYDLQKYHREAWNVLEEYQKGFLYDVVKSNLERGIKEGLYRENLDQEVIAKLHIASSFLLFDETLFPSPQFTKEGIFKEYLIHYLFGIVSEKGYKILNKYLEK